MVLSEPEQAELRSLGALAARALEAGIDGWQPGETSDFEIASVISRELERCGAKAVCLIVGGDDRLRSVRHPLSIGAVLHSAVMAVVVARRGGLHVNSPKNSNRSTGPSYARHCPVTVGATPSRPSPRATRTSVNPAHGANTSRVDRLPSNSASSNSRPLKRIRRIGTSTVSPTLRSRGTRACVGGQRSKRPTLSATMDSNYSPAPALGRRRRMMVECNTVK